MGLTRACGVKIPVTPQVNQCIHIGFPCPSAQPQPHVDAWGSHPAQPWALGGRNGWLDKGRRGVGSEEKEKGGARYKVSTTSPTTLPAPEWTHITSKIDTAPPCRSPPFIFGPPCISLTRAEPLWLGFLWEESPPPPPCAPLDLCIPPP